MTNYKEMYFKMFRASEQAIKLLISVQRECEELYISSPEPELQIIELPAENKRARMRSNSQSTSFTFYR